MWSVEFENLKVQKEIEQLIKARKLNAEDQAIIHAWIQQVSHHGPESIQGDFKWADHALTGEWRGYRSSAFSNRGRIIYQIVEKKILIQIARVTVDHDYKKEGSEAMKKATKKPLDIFKPAKTSGALIKAFRENFSIKQDDMAHACKISQANLSAIEKGRREVGPRIALRLAAFMGLSPDVVLYPGGYESENEYQEVRTRYKNMGPMVAKGS